jgi:hypothetical protein
MNNWTDPIIHWNQLPGTEVRRLLATWGMTPEQIARYDRKHGFTATESVTIKKVVKEATKAPAKVPVKASRQRHTGNDGEIKFVEHRNLYVGFWGGRVVVTKRTKEQCLEVLQKDYNFEK